MRVFLICQQALRPHAVPAYSFWERAFKEGLTEAGHRWLEAPDVDWAEGLTAMDAAQRARWLDYTWTRTCAAIAAAHAREPVDLVLSYLFPNQVEAAAVEKIRALGVPCVNFFCDNVREFTAVPAVYRAFDLHWVPEHEATALYRAARLGFIAAPMPVWVPSTLREAPTRETDAVTFIGSHDVLREALLADAHARGLPLRIQGAGWPGTQPETGIDVGETPAPVASVPRPRRNWRNQLHFFRTHGPRGFVNKLTYALHPTPPRAWLRDALQAPVYGDDYFRLTRESAVTLGINRYPSFRHAFRHPHRYSRLRDIEAPMLGACYLTEECPGLDRLYEPGREIETYRDVAELVAKAHALRADPARRQRLRVAGQRRALAEHTIARSLQKIAAALGLPRDGAHHSSP
jgi:hypothetical protein